LPADALKNQFSNHRDKGRVDTHSRARCGVPGGAGVRGGERCDRRCALCPAVPTLLGSNPPVPLGVAGGSIPERLLGANVFLAPFNILAAFSTDRGHVCRAYCCLI
jgi:hypothetical protein